MKRTTFSVLAVLTTSACGPEAQVPRPTAEPAQPATSQASQLEQLNEELSNIFVLDEALAQREHFKPLCDESGYPLVGNLVTKGITANEFCGALRSTK